MLNFHYIQYIVTKQNYYIYIFKRLKREDSMLKHTVFLFRRFFIKDYSAIAQA